MISDSGINSKYYEHKKICTIIYNLSNLLGMFYLSYLFDK